MNVVLWHRPLIEESPTDREKAWQAAEAFRDEVAQTLPRPFKNPQGRTAGAIVRVWTVDGIAAIMVAARVELESGQKPDVFSRGR